ncbi:glycosyltransferase [Rhodococcus indonesiensis]
MFISWVDHHGRSADIAQRLGLDAVFLPEDIARQSIPIKYYNAARFTVRVLRDRQPTCILLMLPPTPALLTTYAFKPAGTTLIADLHSGFFNDRKWKWLVRPSLKLLRGSTVVVTNSELARLCRRYGVNPIVLHDPLEDRRASANGIRGEYVICPLSYHDDEPVEAILHAASILPNIEFRFTGNAPRRIRQNAPSNVVFTGYVSKEDYVTLLDRARLVLALTTRDLTMQRAGYEALMKGKPQVTAHFGVLREFLGEAAVYVDPSDGCSIAGGVEKVFASTDEYRQRTEDLLSRRELEQRESFLLLRKVMQRDESAIFPIGQEATHG